MSIKIAYCLPSLFSYGGMEKVLTIKANYLAEQLGYDITVILTDGKDKKIAFPLSPKVKIINLDINYDKIWHYNFIIKALAYKYKQIIFKKRLSRVLFQIKPQITISMLRREINFLADIPDDSIKIGELHFNKLNYRDFKTAGKGEGIKAIMAKLWMKHLINNLKKIDKFVVLSEEDKKNWDNDLKNVAVIHNPLDKYPEKLSDCNSKKVIALGRYVEQKGFDMLIESWGIVNEKHPDWVLNIYGDGNREYYQTLVKKHNLEGKIILNKAVKDIHSKLQDSSIFVFPSRYEGFGMAITEAMSCGVPPIAFACPCGPKDIITDNLNGILVEPGDIKAFAQQICYLIENENIRKEMGKMARMRSLDFNIETTTAQWDMLFRGLISDKTTSTIYNETH